MPTDTYEIQGPGGVFEIQSDHEPTQQEILQAVRAYGDAAAAREQTRLQSQAAGPEGGKASRFIAGAAEMLNPIPLVKGVANTVLHPIDTATNLVSSQIDQGRQAYDMARQGRVSEAIGHGMAAALPVLGPIAANVGEEAAETQDFMGAAGKASALIAPFAAEGIYRLRKVNPQRAAVLEREAASQVSERVLAPGNVRFKGKAQAIAPEMLARKMSGGREELRLAAEEGMADAAQRIDDAVNAAGGMQGDVSILGIERGLRDAIADLKDSKGAYTSDRNAARGAALEKRLSQVRSMAGGQGRKQWIARYDDLKKLRDDSYALANDARAYERAGNISLSDEAWAARELGGVIRGEFAARSPETAAANADYAFFKTLNDVLDPVQGRPKSLAPTAGVTGGDRVSSAVAGSLVNPKVAFIMSNVVPFVRGKMADASWQLADAQSKMRLAQAMKKGDIGHMYSIMANWAKFTPKGTTSPIEPQTRSTAPAPSTP